MKQILLKVMSGTLMCLSLVFSSCGNIDNPLEEIGKSNPTVAALAGALDEGAEVSFNFKLVDGGYETPFQVVFTKGEGTSFTFKGYDYQIPEEFDDDMRADIENIFTQIINEENVEEAVKLEYDKAANQLKASFVYVDDEATVPILTVVFDINNNKYTQYVYPFEGFFIWDGVSVNGSDKTKLLATDYSKEADFYFGGFDDEFLARAFTRGGEDDEPINFFRVFYQDGETWADVNKRYKEKAGSPLLIAYSELDGECKDDIDNELEGYEVEDLAYLCAEGEGLPFAYFPEDLNSDLVFVKPDEKVGSSKGYYCPYGFE